ncbi:DUF1127 domain-containing protein [Roseovarius sp. S4756]|uniref:DUF1127 domain-containing protein n=1 Tax=Roseovarius maritimus TaxID=3342637 RepID=UPI00372AEE14
MSVYITREMVQRAAYEHKTGENQSVFGPVIRHLSRLWRQRRAIAALEALDDRMLWDIGIRRSEIRRAVRHPRGRPADGTRPVAMASPEHQAPQGASMAGQGIASA